MVGQESNSMVDPQLADSDQIHGGPRWFSFSNSMVGNSTHGGPSSTPCIRQKVYTGPPGVTWVGDVTPRGHRAMSGDGQAPTEESPALGPAGVPLQHRSGTHRIDLSILYLAPAFSF
ncbi:hypothetical protein CEXT_129611 [Caerostris extrusa]|uniref:Uncharacterized protein n=1 Tax=Caerostris extrusa TaxID=172846 RepID=A0AAV4N3A7_CAEEX|nr:hypothetical protein CEXT_129611 [Caerostris extrusa]